MRRVSHLFALIVLGSLLGVCLPTSPAAADSPDTYYVTTIEAADQPAIRKISEAEAQKRAEVGSVNALKVDSGYYLQGNNRKSSYVYQSDEKDAILYSCRTGSGCTVAGRVGLNLRQTVFGGSSSSWKYEYTYNYKSGPGYTAWIHYQCARNIKAAADKYCYEYSDNPTANEGYTLQGTPITADRYWSRSYSFGTAVGAKKYAQLLIRVTWPSAKTTVDGKFRSWDTKRFTTKDAHLETSTGTGH